jgi:membrane protein YqaA with SNARE-associated domain
MLAATSTMAWLRRLGGPGLILLGIADNSVVPLPGSMDVFTIWLSARHRDLWPYYAAMATVGSLIGGYITYALARKGGKKISRAEGREALSAFRALGLLDSYRTSTAAAPVSHGAVPDRCRSLAVLS